MTSKDRLRVVLDLFEGCLGSFYALNGQKVGVLRHFGGI